MNDDGVVELEIPARPEYLSLARHIIASAAALDPRLRDERIDDLRLLVSEAATNAIEAYVHVGGSDRVLLRCNLADDRVDIEVLDTAGGFDAPGPSLEVASREPGVLDDLPERGFGLPLMQMLADETAITSSDGGTTVRLTVYTTRRP